MNLTINTSEQLREFIPELTTEKNWDALQPRVQWVEDHDLKKIIGPSMLSAFRLMAVEDNESGSPSGSASAPADQSGSASEDQAPEHQEALFRFRRAVAFLVAFDMTKTGDVFFTSTGLQTVSGDNNKSAFQYQKRDIMNDYAEKSDAAIDDLLQYMEEHKQHFSPWSSSLYYTATKELIINNAEQFSTAVPISSSRRTFMALRPYIADNELLYVRSTLGDALFTKVKEFIKDPTTIADETEKTKTQALITRFLVPALANFAMADGINMLTMRYGGEFITFASWLGLSKAQEDKVKEERKSRTTHFVTRGEAMLKQAVDYIIKNPAAFAEFDIPERENTGSVQIENDADKHHFLPGF